jgi:hypothetical protein
MTLAYEYNKKMQKKKLALKRSYTSERGCAVCGERDPIVLLLHHPKPEEKHPQLKVHRKRNQWVFLSYADLQTEMEKCVVLCANCHLREENSSKTNGRHESKGGS